MVQLELPQVDLNNPIMSLLGVEILTSELPENSTLLCDYILALVDTEYAAKMHNHLPIEHMLNVIPELLKVTAIYRILNCVVLVKNVKMQKIFIAEKQRRKANTAIEDQLLMLLNRYIECPSTECFKLVNRTIKKQIISETREWVFPNNTSLYLSIHSQTYDDNFLHPVYRRVQISNGHDEPIDLIDPSTLVIEDRQTDKTDGRNSIYLSMPFWSPISLLIYFHEVFHRHFFSEDTLRAQRAREIMRSGNYKALCAEDARFLIQEEQIVSEAALRYFFDLMEKLGVDIDSIPGLRNDLILHAESALSTYRWVTQNLLKMQTSS